MIKLIGRAIVRSAKYVLPLIKSDGLLILLFFLPCELLYHFFMATQNLYMQAGLTPWPSALGLICVTLLMMLFYLMLLPLRLPEFDANVPENQRKPFWPFVFKYTWPLVLENVRAFAIVVLWLVGSTVAAVILAAVLQLTGAFDIQSAAESLQKGAELHGQNQWIGLLLLFVAAAPAVYFYIKYYFVSYVVMCEPGYEAGQINPLKRSFGLTKGVVIPILVILTLFYFFDGYRTQLRESWPIQENPLHAILASLGFETVAIYANILLFEIYRLKVQGTAATGTKES